MVINEICIEDIREDGKIGDDLIKIIEDAVNKTLEYEKFETPCYISVTIVDEEKIRDLNSEFRNIDSVTDVLSFPSVDFSKGENYLLPENMFEDKLVLGDVILCAKRAKEQCIEFGHSFEREMGYLTCHSVLHLLGYDHMDESERADMRKREEAVMQLMDLGVCRDGEEGE